MRHMNLRGVVVRGVLVCVVLAPAALASAQGRDQVFRDTSVKSLTTLEDADSPGADYLPQPSGWFHKDCSYEVPNGSKLTTNDDGSVTVSLNDAVIAQVPACQHPSKPRARGNAQANAARQAGQPPPPAVNGWLESQTVRPSTTAPLLPWFSGISGQWSVPNKPPTGGGLIYFFNSLMTSGNTEIIQPVLQYGRNGTDWAIATYDVVGIKPATIHFKSRDVIVAVGATISGSLAAFNCTAAGSCSWSMTVSDGTNSSFIFTDGSHKTYVVANPAVMEVYTVALCEQWPAQDFLSFSSTKVFQPGPLVTNSTDVAITQPWQPVISPNTPFCPNQATAYKITPFNRGSSLQWQKR
jgi:hypothetical protein